MFGRSLSKRFSGYATIVGATLLVSVCFLSYRFAAEALQERVVEQAITVAQKNAQYVDTVFTGAKSTADAIAVRQGTRDQKRQLDDPPFFAQLLEESPKEVFGVYFVPENVPWNHPLCGTYITRSTTPKIAPSTYDHQSEDQDWYWIPKTEKHSFITGAYYDSDASITMVSYTRPVFNTRKELMGVAGVDLSLDTIQSMTNAMKISLDGQDPAEQTAILVDAAGMVISHPDKSLLAGEEKEPQSFSELPIASNVDLKQAKGFTWADNHLVVWSTSEFTGWTTVLKVPSHHIMSQLVPLRNMTVGVSLVGIVLLWIITASLARRVAGPLVGITQSVERLALGDCTMEFSVTSRDEVGALASALNKATDHLRSVAKVATNLAEGDLQQEVAVRDQTDLVSHSIRDVIGSWRTNMSVLQRNCSFLDESGKELSESSEECHQVAEHVEHAIVQASGAMVNVTEGSYHIVTSTSELEQRLAALSDHFRVIQESSEIAAGEVGEQLNKTHESELLISEAVLIIDQLRSELTECVRFAEMAVAEVRALSESESSIRAITETLAEISSKVRLLALNASIEAARAGDAGKGFAVVAAEVGNLAEQSASSTSLVDSVLKGVRERILSVESGVVQTQEAIQLGQQTSERSQETMREVTRILSLVQAGAVRVQSATDQQLQVVQEGKASLDEMKAHCQQNTETAERMSDAVVEVHSDLQQVQETCTRLSDTSQNLLRLAQAVTQSSEDLTEVVSHFKLPHSDGASASQAA